MNAKNAPSATNGNNFGRAILACALTCLLAGTAAADDTPQDRRAQTPAAEVSPNQQNQMPLTGTAPSLYQIGELVVDYPTFIDPKAASDCGLTREIMLTVLQRNLQDPGLDVMVINATHERRQARAGVAIEIWTLRHDKFCWSWIDFPVTDQAPILLPPVKVPRNMTLLYWHQKKMVTSSAETHQVTVNSTLASLSRQFLREVKLAMPSAYMDEKGYPNSIEEQRELRKKSIDENAALRLISPSPDVGPIK